MATIAADEIENNVLEVLKVVIATSEKLLSSQRHVMEILQNIKSQQEEIERVSKTNPNLDPEVAQEIRQQKRIFMSSIYIAREFLRRCVNVADYGLNKKLEMMIKMDLEQGKLDNLRTFLHFLEKYLEECKDKLEKFHCCQSETNEIIKSMTKRNKEKLEKTTREANTAKGQLVSASQLGSVFTGTKLLSGIAVVGGLTMISVQPDVGLAIAIGCGAAAYGSFVMEDVVGLHGLEANNDLKLSMKQKSNFEKVLHTVKYTETLKTKEKQIPITAEFKDISSGLATLRITMRFMQKTVEDEERVSAGTEIELQPKLYPSEIHSSSLHAQKRTCS